MEISHFLKDAIEKIKMREKSSKGFLKEVTFDSCLAGRCRREWLPTPAFLPEEFHGQRSLAGCSPWGHFHTWNNFYSLSGCQKVSSSTLVSLCLEKIDSRKNTQFTYMLAIKTCQLTITYSLK